MSAKPPLTRPQGASPASREVDVMERESMGSDSLTELLEHLRLRCVTTGLAEVAELASDGESQARPRYLLVRRGRCRVSIEGEPPIALCDGDLLLLPVGGSTQVLPDVSAEEGEVGIGNGNPSFSVPQTAPELILFKGDIQYGAIEAPPILNLLPRLMVARLEGADDPLASRMLEVAMRHVDFKDEGGLSILNQLLTATCLQQLRRYLLMAAPETPGWHLALRDAEIGPILATMLREPGREWTLQSLAASGLMARSTFARRFRAVVGEAPMDVLTGIRMHQAARLLESDLGLKEISRRVGYRSVSAFSVAFRRWSGMPPLQFRTSRLG